MSDMCSKIHQQIYDGALENHFKITCLDNRYCPDQAPLNFLDPPVYFFMLEFSNIGISERYGSVWVSSKIVGNFVNRPYLPPHPHPPHPHRLIPLPIHPPTDIRIATLPSALRFAFILSLYPWNGGPTLSLPHFY